MVRVFGNPIKVEGKCLDLMGHVIDQMYFKWMEATAIAHSEAGGWPTEKYFEAGGVWIAKQHWVEYIRPVLPGEELVMYTWCANMFERGALRRYQLMHGGETCMKAATDWAFVNTHTGRPIPVFPEVRAIFPEIPPDDTELLERGINIHEFKRQNL